MPSALHNLSSLTKKMDALVFPGICAACGQQPAAVGEPVLLCRDCNSRLNPFPRPHCKACGGTVDGVLDVCGECAANPARVWDHAVSVYPYGGYVRQLIHRFKYRNGVALAPVFAHAMLSEFRQHSIVANPDLLVPVPMHWRRKIRRGYNQTELLTSLLSAWTAIPAAPLLRRYRNNRKQATLDRKTRQKNVKQVFSRKGKTNIEGYHIVLLDDVMTTGATLDAAAAVLKQAGAAVVEVLTLARG